MVPATSDAVRCRKFTLSQSPELWDALAEAALGATQETQMSKDPYFYVYEDRNGKWRWHLRSGGDIIADSGQGYATKYGAERGVAAVKRVAPNATVVVSS